ncbi:MAG: hypothetical protein Q9205_007422 [Flavoplaca limonia]
MAQHVIAPTVRDGYEMQDVRTDSAQASASSSGHSTDHEKMSVDAEKVMLEDFDDPPDLADIPASAAPYSFEEEQAVLRKFDRHLVLFIALLYMLGFLDRSNIGNAKIAGMSDDLHLSSSEYEWTLRSFYITYVLFEWMPILYTVLSPSKYIASCVLLWGAIASFQALATSYESLFFLRALLGISEAAFSPGVPVFLAFFYRRDELAYRIGLFISAAPLATSFASSLAWLITKVGQGLPIAPWRMLFLVEGFPSVLISVFAFHHIPNSPGEAKYLSDRERRVAELRLRKGETKTGLGRSSRKFKRSEVWEALKDPKCYLTADSDAKKGTGVAILNIIGQLGPFIGTALYPESDRPYYVRGMTACAGFMLLVGKS